MSIRERNLEECLASLHDKKVQSCKKVDFSELIKQASVSALNPNRKKPKYEGKQNVIDITVIISKNDKGTAFTVIFQKHTSDIAACSPSILSASFSD